MNAADRIELAGIQREVTRHIQRLASGCDKASDEQHDRKLADFRTFALGLRTGLTLMGMTEGTANEVIRKAGFDFRLNSYTTYRKEPLAAFRGLEKAS